MAKSALVASRLRKIDFSGNQLGPVFFNDTFSVEEIRWEKDKCNGSRVLPNALFAQNQNLKSFWYSADTSRGCFQLELPSELFEVDLPNLATLRLANSNLTWLQVKPVLKQLKKLEVLDLSGNKIEKVNLTDLPSRSVNLNLKHNENLSCE